MGAVSEKIVNDFHSFDDFIDASMICDLEPPHMTGHVCRKSPNVTMTFLPNGLFESIHLQQTSLTHSKTPLFAIGASSQIMRAACWMSSPRGSSA
jgi:hypothetical protein